MILLIVVLLILQALDAISTNINLQRGACELNPMLRYLMTLIGGEGLTPLLLVKVIPTLLVCLLIYRVARLFPQTGLVLEVGLFIFIVFMFGVVVWNFTRTI